MHPGQATIGLEDLRLVAAVAEAGTLAGAARALGLNHASAWRRLGALEARIGVRLFDRGRGGYAPTPAGEEAVAVARRTLDGIDGLERRLAGQDVRPTGTVRLTTPETLTDLVAPVLLALRATHPGIVVEVVTGNDFFTLTRRDADVALRPAAAAPEGLVARRVATVATAVYAAPGRYAPGPADAPDRDWLAPDDSLSHLGSARWIAANVPAGRIVHRASSLTALAAAARAGLGVAALPCVLADPDPRLERIADPVRAMDTPLWLITHPDLRRTARVRAVLDALAERLAGDRARLAGEAAADRARPPQRPRSPTQAAKPPSAAT